jgi:hypothetical protein
MMSMIFEISCNWYRRRGKASEGAEMEVLERTVLCNNSKNLLRDF